jgi:hypothetical protein
MALGHVFAPNPEIGAATGVEFLPDGQLVAAAEPVRRGGGGSASEVCSAKSGESPTLGWMSVTAA